MKAKILNLCVLVTSLIGYLEWGRDMHMFLAQGEAAIIVKFFHDPMSVIHPLTLLPLAGQLILLCTLFQRTPGKVLTYIGVACLGMLMLFIFLVGIISLDFRIAVSVIPFIVSAVLTVVHQRKIKTETRRVTQTSFPD
jgi:cobalamin biosynthesis protein CobD/CbiB